jgi:hypothetical protein
MPLMMIAMPSTPRTQARVSCIAHESRGHLWIARFIPSTVKVTTQDRAEEEATKKKNLRHAGVVVTFSALSIMTLAGCTASAATEEDNVTAACVALDDLAAALTTAESDLGEAETVGDLRTIRESVAAAYEEADSALDAVAADRAQALTDSWEKVLDSAKAIDSDTSLADARDSLVEEARDVAQTRQDTATDLECE